MDPHSISEDPLIQYLLVVTNKGRSTEPLIYRQQETKSN